MSRGKKLLLLLGVLVLLAAAAVAVGRLSPKEEDEAAIEDSSEVIFAVDAGSVTSLAWTYEGESLSFSHESDRWVYDGDAGFPADTSCFTAMLGTLAEVRANKTIPDVSDLSQYGLAEPACSVTVTANGESTPLLFGDETGLGGEVYCDLGDGNVYLVDSYIPGYFSYGLLDVVKKESLPLSGYVTGFRVDAKGETLTADRVEDAEGKVGWISQEKSMTADSEKVNDFILLLTGLTSGQCVSYNAGAEALEEYGLRSASAAKINLSWTEDEEAHNVALTLGAGIDGGSYVCLDGSNMVYAVDAATFGNIIYTSWEDLLPDDGAADA